MIRKQTYELLIPIVNAMNRLFEGDSIVQNIDESWTIESCNTLWLTKGSKFNIGLLEYEVIDIEPNESITVSGEEIPELNFVINLPFFSHGTTLAKNSELNATPNAVDKLPMIWLHDPTEERFSKDTDSIIDRESDCDLFFMAETNYPDWLTLDHDKYAIKPMRNMVESFLNALNYSGKTSDGIDYDILDHANFGRYNAEKGHIKKVFDDDMSGCQLMITIPFLVDSLCHDCGDIEKPQTVTITDGVDTIEKYPGEAYVCTGGVGADATVRNSDNSFNESVASGGTLVLEDVTYSVYVNGVFNASGSLPAAVGNTINIL